jgi:antirestriction protein ArdC
MGWYRVVKTIKGHRYVYLQRTWREGKHVRTESRYVGPADGGGGRAHGKRGNRAESEAKPVNTTTSPTDAAETRNRRRAARLDPAIVDRTFLLLNQAVRIHPSTPPWGEEPNERALWQRDEGIERLIANLGVRLTNEPDHAYYDRLRDRVNMPDGAYFLEIGGETATQTYYTTLLHELVHWSGAPHRFARRLGLGPDSEEYAREELVAEVGALILAQQFGVAAADLSRHVDYFQYWLGRCDDTEEALAYARRRAEKAVRYILRHGVNTTRPAEEGMV